MKDDSPRAKASWRRLLCAVHHDERGAVSIETVLIIAAIALPILIFLYKFAWPFVRDKVFWKNIDGLTNDPGGPGGGAR